MRTLIALLACGVSGRAFAQDAADTVDETPPPPGSVAADSATTGDGDTAVDVAAEPADEELTRLQALEARLDGVDDVLMHHRQELADTKLRLLERPDLTIDLEGEYRVRGHVFANLFEGQTRDARYMDHWLRLRPVFKYRELAKLNLEVRGLTNTVWGDNESLAATSLFAGNPSATGTDGQNTQSFRLNRAWMEFNIPVGVLRIGRQPSQWGLGALVNPGDGFDDSFGENRNETTFDRVMFATKPIAIAQTIMGQDPADIPLFFAVGVDRLVEDPLTQYYGYECERGLVAGDDGFDARCDTNGDGTTDVEHDFTDDTRTDGDRGQDWWADQDDDVVETVFALIYRGNDIDYLGGHGDLNIGGYAIHRYQHETDSDVIIPDLYVEGNVHGVTVGFEGVGIYGRTRAITLPGSFVPGGGDGQDPLAKKAAIFGYVSRLGYERETWSVTMEHGFASGDDNVADGRFTGRPLNPDHNVGLLLYEEVIARVTSQLWTSSADGLWSKGGVYNSRYVFPLVQVHPLDNWTLQGAFLAAWPHKPDGRFIRCAEGDKVECAQYDATSSLLGWETDFAIKHRWHEHLLFSLEMGYAHATDRLPVASAGLNPTGNFFTAQSRIAWEF